MISSNYSFILCQSLLKKFKLVIKRIYSKLILGGFELFHIWFRGGHRFNRWFYRLFSECSR
jgi:hypothetical protein